jgi:hypothetical protein
METQKRVLGSIDFTLSSPLKPWGMYPEHYAFSGKGTVTVLTNDAAVAAGEISFALAKIAEARAAGVNMEEVTRAHSFDFNLSSSGLFDIQGRFRPRHKIERQVDNLLYIEKIEWESGFGSRSLLAETVETTIAVLAPSGLVLAFFQTINKFGLIWEEHGFKSAGKSGFLLRDNLEVDPDRYATRTIL